MRLQTTITLLFLLGLAGQGTAVVSAADPKAPSPKPSQQERWDAAYRDDRRPPWDISRPATELKQAVENGTLLTSEFPNLRGGITIAQQEALKMQKAAWQEYQEVVQRTR